MGDDWDGVQAYNSPNAVSDRLQKENARLRAELAEAKARVAELRADASTLDAVVHALDIEDGFLEPVEAIEGLYARAEQAEKRVAELETGWETAETYLMKAIARAERAEVERDAAKAHVVNLEEIVKGVHFLRKQAEAERDAVREFVSKQAEDEGLWFVSVSITEDYLQRALRSLHEIVEGKSSSECARAALNPSPKG